ncbi:hypothetical protein [Alicyclobacillus acidiphilus]|uniref:hypothetical protein n=1 Tax=Alicyclobacillus acidiphilus TaxID=182455 RepID=UPI0008337976|nr:hypothetical protein [Alicyclobacillus acidiphilus]
MPTAAMPIAKDIIIGAIILILIIRRQLTPRPLSGRLLVLPLILGAYALYEAASNPSIAWAGWVSLMLTLALSFLVGLIRGRIVRVYQENGVWMVAGSVKSLLLWLVSIPIRYGLRFALVPLLGAGAAFHGPSSSLPYLFSIAGLLLGRALMLTLRHPEAVRQARQNHLARRAVQHRDR